MIAAAVVHAAFLSGSLDQDSQHTPSLLFQGLSVIVRILKQAYRVQDTPAHRPPASGRGTVLRSATPQFLFSPRERSEVDDAALT